MKSKGYQKMKGDLRSTGIAEQGQKSVVGQCDYLPEIEKEKQTNRQTRSL